LRVACQNSLSAEVYGELMLDRIDGNYECRLTSLREIEKEKLRVARAYNKKVEGEIVSDWRVGMENDFARRV
jgi:hypothetical protein